MFSSLLEKRRSIRRYVSKPVENEKISRLIETTLRSPSSRGINPWHFVVVNRPELLDRLSQAKPHGASFLKRAPLGIVVCADPEKSDVWVEDASIASILLHLAASDMGLGSCWIQIRERMHSDRCTAENYVKEVLHIPEHLKVAAIIAIGYPNEMKPPHGKDSLQFEKVSYNRFGSSGNIV